LSPFDAPDRDIAVEGGQTVSVLFSDMHIKKGIRAHELERAYLPPDEKIAEIAMQAIRPLSEPRLR
jgi:hypothetical protein